MPIPIKESPDGVLAVFLLPEKSDLAKSQKSFLAQYPALENQIYMFEDMAEVEQDSTLGRIITQAGLQTLFKDCLILLEKKDSKYTYLTHRDRPEAKYDWIEVVAQFEKNYQDRQADDEGLWRWGQIVPQDGEYLCRDCGYIEEFQAGQIFPICEVCLAGDPEGPVALADGFWESI